jgi:hypothetical protein
VASLKAVVVLQLRLLSLWQHPHLLPLHLLHLLHH